MLKAWVDMCAVSEPGRRSTGQGWSGPWRAKVLLDTRAEYFWAYLELL